MAYSPQTELNYWLDLANDPNLRRYIQARILQEIFAGENAAARLRAVELYETFPVSKSSDVLEDISTEQLLDADRRLREWLDDNGGLG